jgi:hypothetical protein
VQLSPAAAKQNGSTTIAGGCCAVTTPPDTSRGKGTNPYLSTGFACVPVTLLFFPQRLINGGNHDFSFVQKWVSALCKKLKQTKKRFKLNSYFLFSIPAV